MLLQEASVVEALVVLEPWWAPESGVDSPVLQPGRRRVEFAPQAEQ